VLTLSNVQVVYDKAIEAVRDVSMTVETGRIVALLGSNGAGKSTLLKAIFGLVGTKSGRVRLGARNLDRLKPSAIARLGVGYVPQRDNVFPSLTVAENLEIGLAAAPEKPLARRLDAMYALFPRLAERRRQKVGTMSGGERQMVAMARALAPEPSLLLLDEPSAGLAPTLVEVVFEQVKAIHKLGVAILVVEQNARRALALADRGYVLDLGRNAYEGSGCDLIEDPRVAELYLGAAPNALDEDPLQ
jgi:branched-chain amino acid transport system ATP-binding protein